MKNWLFILKDKFFLIIALTVVFSLGVVFRVTGIDSGLPFLYDTDEPAFVVRAFKILASGDLNPQWFGHPGTLTIYSLAACFGFYGSIGLAVGHFEDIASIIAVGRNNPAEFYLIGRAVMVFFAVATLFLIYALARRITSQWVALLATLILAVSPLHVQFSRIIRTDIQQTFLIVVVAWFAVSIAKTGRWKDYLAAGFVLGLAVATKYPSVIAASMIIVAWIADGSRDPSGWLSRFCRLAGAGIASLVGAFLASPFLFLDFSTAWSDILGEARPEHLTATSPGFLGAVTYYLFSPLTESVTIVGLILAGIGVVVVIRRSWSEGSVLVVFPVLYLLFISSLNLVWARWAIPILPFLALFAAIGFSDLSRRLTNGLNRPIAGCLIGAAIIIWLVLPFNETLTNTREYAGEDTRTAAFSWASENIPPGSRILVERYTPQLENGRYQLFEVDGTGSISAITTHKKYVSTYGFIGRLADIEELYTEEIDYIILGNDYDRRLADYGPQGASVQPYMHIMDNHKLLFEVDGLRGKRLGNIVRIYAVVTGGVSEDL